MSGDSTALFRCPHGFLEGTIRESRLPCVGVLGIGRRRRCLLRTRSIQDGLFGGRRRTDVGQVRRITWLDDIIGHERRARSHKSFIFEELQVVGIHRFDVVKEDHVEFEGSGHVERFTEGLDAGAGGADDDLERQRFSLELLFSERGRLTLITSASPASLAAPFAVSV